MTFQNNSFNHVLKTIKEFKNLKKSSKHQNMYLLKSKAPQISKNVPTLFFSAVFKMSKHDISTLLHWSTEKNSHGLNYCTEALKKTARVSFSSSNLQPSVPSWDSDLDVVIVDIRWKKFALDVTIGSYQDLMDLHCFWQRPQVWQTFPNLI